jgi:two-component system, LuxR family, sensor kinase FixL
LPSNHLGDTAAAQRAAQRRTEDAEANYRGQVEAIDRSHMRIEFSMDGAILQANENYLRAFGYTSADIDGKNHTIFVTEEFKKSKEYAEFWDDLRKGVFQSGIFSRIGKEGKEVWIAASYNPILDAEGRPIKVVKFATDMTERIKTQNELKDTEARLTAILNGVVDGIITIDATGTIVSFNPAATKMFEYEEADVFGQNIKMLLPEPIRGAFDGYLAHHQLRGKSMAIGLGRELEGLTRSGRVFPLELMVTEMSLQGHKFFVGLVRDITERKAAEEKSLHYMRALERSNLELDAFAYAASHDLKAPLRVIHNASTWIEEDLAGKLTAETQENMNLLRSRVRRMDRLLDDLLEYSRIGHETVDRHAVAISGAALMENIQGLLSPPQGFVVDASPALADIEVFRMPLQQILINLISNAIKHHDKNTGLVEVSVEDLGAMFRFSVKDDGPGIPAQYHEQIFKMFETLRSRDQVEGSGMGLAMVRKHVDVAGGEFTLESAVGQGSTFSFTWPKDNGSANRQRANSRESEKYHDTAHKVEML